MTTIYETDRQLQEVFDMELVIKAEGIAEGGKVVLVSVEHPHKFHKSDQACYECDHKKMRTEMEILDELQRYREMDADKLSYKQYCDVQSRIYELMWVLNEE